MPSWRRVRRGWKDDLEQQMSCIWYRKDINFLKRGKASYCNALIFNVKYLVFDFY